MEVKMDSRTKWRDEFYVRAYQYATQGMSNRAIGLALGLKKPDNFMGWCKKRPALRAAIEEGRKQRADTSNFADFVYERLPENLQRMWRKLDILHNDDRTGPEQLEALFEGHGVKMRQHLFLHAYIHNLFNPSTACRMVGISNRTLKSWVEHDPDFAELIQELNFHKKNWLEEHLFRLVAAGNPSATIFANRTINKDRGYDVTKKVEITGKVEHEHHHLIDLDSLDLPHEVRAYILEAVRRREVGKDAPPPALPAPVDDAQTITVAGFERPPA